MKQFNPKSFILGILVTALIFSMAIPALASVNLDVATNRVNIFVRGNRVVSTGDTLIHVNGEEIPSSILYRGATYLPLRMLAEMIGMDVGWDGRTSTVSLTDPPAAPTPSPSPSPTPQPSPSPSPSPNPTLGTRTNPFPANNTAVIEYHRWRHVDAKSISLSVERVIAGSEANAIIHSENRFNRTPASGQEWRIYIFNLRYVSGNENDELRASDIIWRDTFFSRQGQSMVIHDTATLGDLYRAYSVHNVRLFPGGRSRVVYAVLTNTNEGIPLIRIPHNGGNDFRWVSCDVR
jgi:hypothetical protein